MRCLLLGLFFTCGVWAMRLSELPAVAQPASGTQPWQPTSRQQDEQLRAVEADKRTTIQPDHVYTLPELVDLAEQHNPETRAAWYQARAEAARVGIARTDLFPVLTAVMMTNTTRDGLLLGPTFVRQTLGF